MSLISRLHAWWQCRSRGVLEVFSYDHEYQGRLRQIWEPPAQPPVREEQSSVEVIDTGIRFSRRPPPPLDWKIAFTAKFSKAIAAVDKSMQGRVLLALADISAEPATPRGDTIKPLTGELQGLWRYRVGDYRLVYEPLSAEQMVVLVDFAARGGVYE